MNDTTRDKLVGEGLPVPPVVPVIPTPTAALGGHRSPDQPLHNITFFAVIGAVLGRNIAPPLLKLVISPLELPWQPCGVFIYTPLLPPISVFLSCASKIPNLSQTALPPSDSSLTFEWSVTGYSCC